MSNLKDIKEFGCPYPKIQCKSCTWNYADTCNFDFDSYQRGMKDKEKELKEHNVFVSNKPIEDIVLDARKDERERIIAELEEKKHKVYSTYSLSENNIDLGITYGLETAIEIVRGE